MITYKKATKDDIRPALDPKKGTLLHRIARHGDNGHTWFQDAWVFEWNGNIEEIRLQEGETCEVMWATADKIRKMMDAGKFVEKEVYPYFDEMVGNGG